MPPQVAPKVIVLRRTLSNYGRLEPGFWRFIVGMPHLACPQCGTVCDITDRKSQIDRQGNVRGRVECERDGCGWQEFVRLGGYEYQR